MKDINKMRLGVLRELKQIISFFQDMEKGVKSRDPARIYPAYIYLTNLTYHMQEGDLTPLSIELKQAILHHELIDNCEHEWDGMLLKGDGARGKCQHCDTICYIDLVDE